MKMPLNSSVVMELDGRRWLLQAASQGSAQQSAATHEGAQLETRTETVPQCDSLRLLADDERVPGAQIHFTDFGGAIQGVEQIAAARRFAAPIIEKNLRDRGESESTSQVLLLDTRSKSGTTRALYSAVPSDRYEQYCETARQHDDHVLLIPYMQLLLRRGRAASGKVVCVFFQHGLSIDLLMLVDSKAYAFVQVTSAGSSPDEWQRALMYLLEELKQLRGRLEQPIHSSILVNWDPEEQADIDQICMWLEVHGGLEVTCEEQHRMHLDGKTVRSSLPALFPMFRGTMAANRVPALPLYLAERMLPAAAVLIAGVGLALLVLAFQWQQQAASYEVQFAETLQNAQQADIPTVRAQLQQASANLLSTADLAFVAQTARALSRPSLATALADIREVLPANVYLSSVRFADSRNNSLLRVEGWVEADMAGVNAVMERLIEDFAQLGYGVRANNLRGYMRRNLFQLELDLDEVNREI